MKRTIYKLYRHTMRRLARWFLGFWDCPTALKRDRKAEMVNMLKITTLVIGLVVIFGLSVILLT
jgi:hypothetical protein